LWQDKGLHLGGSPPPRRAHQPSLPVECVVGPDRELVLVKGGKKLTVEQVERYTVRLRSNLSFRPSFSEIVDLSEVEEVDLKADEFLKLADQIDPFSTTAKRVPGPDLGAESCRPHA
jgi:hypothetical protein